MTANRQSAADQAAYHRGMARMVARRGLQALAEAYLESADTCETEAPQRPRRERRRLTFERTEG